MDGQRFDQLAKALARGAPRRRVLEGLVGGTIAGAVSLLWRHSVRAQCTWSGTFETTFGDMIMTLNEAGGQVTGSYTFTENNATVNGTISGTVRTDSPGSTDLDGSWREPADGGRLRFTMALDPCTQFTGTYTTDPSDAWRAGWDGVRIDADAVDTLEFTLFTNPGDTRVAAYTVEGHVVTVFGPKDAEGLVEYINHAQIDPPDGDPRKRVFLDFDGSGTSSRATLGSGETMFFEWVSPTRVIITYQNADGSEQVQVPFEVDATESDGAAAHASTTRAQGGSQVGMMAYSGHSHSRWLQRESRAAPAAQTPVSNRGIIKVQCGGAQPVDAAVRGKFWNPFAQTPVGGEQPIYFTPVEQGVYEYTLPLAAPAPSDWTGQEIGFRAVIFAFCSANLAMTVRAVSGAAICASLGLAAGLECLAILGSYRLICGLFGANTGYNIAAFAVDTFTAERVKVEAIAEHPKLGEAMTSLSADAGEEIPPAVIQFPQVAGIDSNSITIEPLDPGPGENYSVYADTVCAPPGTELTILVRGSDGYFNSTVESLTETVTGGTLYVQGGAQGIYDEITIQLCCAVKDSTTRKITF